MRFQTINEPDSLRAAELRLYAENTLDSARLLALGVFLQQDGVIEDLMKQWEQE